MDKTLPGVKGSSMEKWMCWGSVAVAGLLFLLFLLDLVLGIIEIPFAPFSFISPVVDVLGIITSGPRPTELPGEDVPGGAD